MKFVNNQSKYTYALRDAILDNFCPKRLSAYHSKFVGILPQERNFLFVGEKFLSLFIEREILRHIATPFLSITAGTVRDLYEILSRGGTITDIMYDAAFSDGRHASREAQLKQTIADNQWRGRNKDHDKPFFQKKLSLAWAEYYAAESLNYAIISIRHDYTIKHVIRYAAGAEQERVAAEFADFDKLSGAQAQDIKDCAKKEFLVRQADKLLELLDAAPPLNQEVPA